MAAAAVMRPSHRAARVTAAPAAVPRSPLREIRDTRDFLVISLMKVTTMDNASLP